MALLKSYTCANCGGVLNFDEDQEIFECPFCGQEFNYTDFHRDELLNQASGCLKELRYGMAKEKYDMLLSKNPRDFEALRGRILCAGKWKQFYDIQLSDKMLPTVLRTSKTEAVRLSITQQMKTESSS